MTADYRTPSERRAAISTHVATKAAPAKTIVRLLSPKRLVTKLRANTFFSDISEFQPVVSNSYKYPLLSFRADNGWRTDSHAHANWSHAKARSDIKVVIAYVVYIPGQLDAVMARLKALFGTRCPAKLVLMIDMESGEGFAGSGNHSSGGNAWLDEFAKYTGSRNRVIAYANHYDFQTNWPQIHSWTRKITAGYGYSDPGSYGWQYFGGMKQFGSPAGYPRSAAPFGSWVDMNVIHKSISQIEKDFGLVAAVSPKPVVKPTQEPAVKPSPKPKPTHKPTPKPTPHPKVTYYVIKRGDTLGGIAAKHHTTWKQLQVWNKTLIKNPNVIKVGWKIRVA